MEDVEAAPEERDPQRQKRACQEAPDEFRGKARLARGIEGQRVAEDLDPLPKLVAGVETPRLRADDANPVTGLGQCRRLEPNAAVERHREILHDDKDAAFAQTVTAHASIHASMAPIIDTRRPAHQSAEADADRRDIDG
jgi:hypothetical protein